MWEDYGGYLFPSLCLLYLSNSHNKIGKQNVLWRMEVLPFFLKGAVTAVFVDCLSARDSTAEVLVMPARASPSPLRERW